MKQTLIWIARIALIVLAFWMVLKKVDIQQLKTLLQVFHPIYLAPALLLYLVSQLVSAKRLQYMYSCIGVNIPYRINLALYFKAMFYGLFLPGGVSGDAFKIVYLQKQTGIGYKPVIAATLLDRLNGMAIIGTYCLLIFISVSKSLAEALPINTTWLLLLLALGWIGYWLIIRFMFPSFLPVFIRTNRLSVVIQLLQAMAFWCLLRGLSTAPTLYLPFTLLFYLGSIFSAIPLSINGIGIREWVMVTGSSLLVLHVETGLSAALLFSLISSASCLIGAFVKLPDFDPSPKH